MASGGSLPSPQTGAYNGTGVAQTIGSVGFQPKYVKFLNKTTGAAAEWSDTMTDAHAVTHDSGTDASLTSQGVTPTDTGFSIGTNAVINNSGDEIHWIAFA